MSIFFKFGRETVWVKILEYFTELSQLLFRIISTNLGRSNIEETWTAEQRASCNSGTYFCDGSFLLMLCCLSCDISILTSS